MRIQVQNRFIELLKNTSHSDYKAVCEKEQQQTSAESLKISIIRIRKIKLSVNYQIRS